MTASTLRNGATAVAPAVRAELLDVLGGYLRTQAIATVAKLGVADLVGDDPLPVSELAARTGTDPGALHRVMRLLASAGIFSETAPGRFIATPLSDGLREDRPGTVRYLALQQGGPAYRASGEMLEAVRTGKPVAQKVFGMPFFDYLAADTAASEVFNRAMADGASTPAAALGYDWGHAGLVADIGGGNGTLLAAVLAVHPHLRGVVLDLPHVVAEAPPVLEQAGVADRCETLGADFFADDLPPADTYVLARILHDWDDERAAAILRNCRRSIAGNGRVLIVEQVMPAGNEPTYAKLVDLIMLTMAGGKERTEGEWRSLLAEGGFELVGITGDPATCLIEAAPA
jgi:O-methyltransferase domain